MLKDAQVGIGVHELCRKHGIYGFPLYKWRTKYAGLEVSNMEEASPVGRRKPSAETDEVAEQALDIPGAEGRRGKKLVAPKAKRTAAQWMAERFGLSQRRVCHLLALDRNTLRYRRRRRGGCGPGDADPRDCGNRRRYGCPRIYVRLRREGWSVNHKKVERLYYRDEGLSLRRRRRKKAVAVPRVALPKPTQPGRCYAMDFVHYRLVRGRRFKCLTMTDLYSKEVPVIEVDVSIGGARVCRFLTGCSTHGRCRTP